MLSNPEPLASLLSPLRRWQGRGSLDTSLASTRFQAWGAGRGSPTPTCRRTPATTVGALSDPAGTWVPRWITSFTQSLPAMQDSL